MNEAQKEQYGNLLAEYDNWWGWEDGYTWEEGSDFFEDIAGQALHLLKSIEQEYS